MLKEVAEYDVEIQNIFDKMFWKNRLVQRTRDKKILVRRLQDDTFIFFKKVDIKHLEAEHKSFVEYLIEELKDTENNYIEGWIFSIFRDGENFEVYRILNELRIDEKLVFSVKIRDAYSWSEIAMGNIQEGIIQELQPLYP